MGYDAYSQGRATENLVFDVDFEWQREIIECDARVQFMSGGRGCGKTSTIARVKLLKAALSNIDGHYAFYSPSYEVARGEKNRITRDPVISQNILEAPNSPTPFIRFISGSIIRYRSTVLPETLLGRHYDGIVLDEVQTHSEFFIDNYVFTTLAARKGWFLALGQFCEFGKDGHIWKRLFAPGQQPNQTRHKSWIIPSSMGFMYSGEAGKAELEAVKASTDPITFKRQYMAEPVECANLAFRREDLNASKVGNIVDKPASGTPVVIGLDIGRVCDNTFWVALQPLSKDKAIVLNCGMRPLGERFEIQAVEIERVRAAYGARTVCIDNTGGLHNSKVAPSSLATDVYTAFFKKTVAHCRPFYWTRKSKAQICSQLQLAFEQRRIMVPAALGVLHQQLAQFRWELNRGFIDFAAPKGCHDDGVAALAMAWNSCLLGQWSADNDPGIGINAVLM